MRKILKLLLISAIVQCRGGTTENAICVSNEDISNCLSGNDREIDILHEDLLKYTKNKTDQIEQLDATIELIGERFHDEMMSMVKKNSDLSSQIADSASLLQEFTYVKDDRNSFEANLKENEKRRTDISYQLYDLQEVVDEQTKNMTELQIEIRKWKKRRTSEIRTHQKEQELMKKNMLIEIRNLPAQMQLRNMTTHYTELNNIHNDLLMLATKTLDTKLENFTNEINRYHEERSLSETRLKKIAAFAFSGSIQCNRSLDFLTDELEKIDDVQQKFDDLSNELDVQTKLLEHRLSDLHTVTKDSTLKVMGRNDELPILKSQLREIEKHIQNFSSNTLPEAETKFNKNESRDENLTKLEDRIQDLESNLLQMEIDHDMLLDLAETVNVADLKSMMATTVSQSEMIGSVSQFLSHNNATMEEIEYEINSMKEIVNEIKAERNSTEKQFNEMTYVEFGAQENRDFDYEKYVIGERIQLLENQMRHKEESTGKFINVIKDLVIQIQTLDNRMQYTFQNSIKSETIDTLKDLIENAGGDLQKMKIEYANMRNKIETLARVNEEARVAHQTRFDIVMKRFSDDSLREQRSAERIAQKIKTDILQMNNEKMYLDEQLENLEHEEITNGLRGLQIELEELQDSNMKLKSDIARMDLAFDPILKFTGTDPDDSIRLLCKKMLVEHHLIGSN